MMNSSRKIEVDMIFCDTCEKTFFELKNYELKHCPHCETVLSKRNCSVEVTLKMGIEVDYKTGRLFVVGA